jgi:uncharacterized protein YjiS (DUF1127 family)
MVATTHDVLHLSRRPQPSLIARAADRLFHMVERHRQRLALQSLSDQALSDIGISRADAQLEADRPFWR